MTKQIIEGVATSGITYRCSFPERHKTEVYIPCQDCAGHFTPAPQSRPMVLITIEQGVAEAQHGEDVRVMIVDLDPLKVGEVESVKETLPDSWDTDWKERFPNMVTYINSEIVDAESDAEESES